MKTLVLFSALATAALAVHLPEMDLDAIGIIQHWGYPSELHTAQTSDGYLLDLHRIPGRRNEQNPSSGRPVVIFQHGLDCASDNWILNTPENSAGFQFADAGLDVWLTNTRGNKYTRHVNYTWEDEGFWHYTWDEMQKLDLPAIFDKIQEVTGQSSFYYVGHSQGTVIMFAKLADEPSFSTRVKRFFATGPATQLKYMSGPFALACNTDYTKLGGIVWSATGYSNLGGFLLDPDFVGDLSNLTCADNAIDAEYCASIFYTILGFSSTTNLTRLPVYLSHIPAGSAVANFRHHCQSVNYGGFRWFDFPTEEENQEAYGSSSPPDYDLTQIKNVKIHLYSSHDDIITPRRDMDEFTIPAIADNIVEDLIVDGFSHMDFLWSNDVGVRVNQPIIDAIIGDQN